MIVVTIIGLVALIAIPAVGRARTQAQVHTCKYNQKLIFDQLNVYCMDTGDPLTIDRFPNLCASRDALVPNIVARQYIKKMRVFSCPANPDRVVQHDYKYLTTGREIIGLDCNIRNQHNP
jgi:type II secretory pathway pseudopilin PulG